MLPCTTAEEFRLTVERLLQETDALRRQLGESLAANRRLRADFREHTDELGRIASRLLADGPRRA
jgi:hypothetical protein